MLPAEERLDDLEKVFQELEELSESSAIVVEGKKDAEALKRLGITRNVVTLSRGVSMFALSEDIGRRWKRAVVLTDWDRKGGHLARLLSEALTHNGVTVNQDIRAQLAMLSKKDVKDIQSLPRMVSNLRSHRLEPVRRVRANLGKRI